MAECKMWGIYYDKFFKKYFRILLWLGSGKYENISIR